MTTARFVLLTLRVSDEQDVFLTRQRGREVAAIVGLDNQDQVRVATAISELSRELCVLPTTARIELALAPDVAPALTVTASWTGRLARAAGETAVAALDGVRAATRLTDRCTVHVGPGDEGGTVELAKSLPSDAPPLTADRLDELRAACRRTRPSTTLGALRTQNEDQLVALEELRARQDDLVRANAELEETNRGVMALHAELSAELEQTNQGVVALYAELDEATTRLREASESKTRFWRSVSHELRAPLNSVIGLARLLLDTGSDPLSTEQRYQLSLIRDSGATLLALVNELLDVAKAEAGQIEVRPRATDLTVVLDNLRASLEPMITTPDVALVVDVPVPVPPLWLDADLLGRVLRNLVGNALKFTERGEVRVTVRTDPVGGLLEILVADTGVGIAAEHHDHVFEEFFQVPGPLQRSRTGTGLGLPYARRLVRLMDGEIRLESVPGRGTTFAVALPLVTAPQATAPTFGDVLVVDDDPAFRTLVRRLVDPFTERVRDAVDGRSALAELRAATPDLVLLDLDIPAPDGAAVLADMRGRPELAAVPVVVVTAARLDSDTQDALNATAVVLDKADVSTEAVQHAAHAALRAAERTRP